MQPNDENLTVENEEAAQPEFTPGAQPPVQPMPNADVSPATPSVDGFSQPTDSTPPADPVEPTSLTPPTEPVSFQPPVTESGTNPEPFQTPAAPAPVEPPKHVGFFGRLFGKK
jgi:hypothetical protein